MFQQMQAMAQKQVIIEILMYKNVLYRMLLDKQRFQIMH